MTGDSGADTGDTADDRDDASNDSADDTADDYDLPDAECPADAGYVGFEPHAARTLAGTGDWVIDFDETAESNGYADCAYHREWAETVERQGHGWQCPDCDFFTAGTGEVTSGYDDCAALISSADAVRTEEGDCLAGADRQIDVEQGPERSVAGRDPLQFEHRGHGWPASMPRYA